MTSSTAIRTRRLVVPVLFPAIGLSLTLAQAGAQLQRDAENPAGRWEVLEGCVLLTNAPMDGDSFHVLHKDREYIFRLYFVDAPETDPTLRDRIEDQAFYFGVSTESIPRAGRLAAEFTRNRLAAQPFTIVTRWQNAAGRSALARFYGIVLVKGKRHAEELVRAGWVRIYGLRANWPEETRSTTLINQLKNLEIDARQHQRGVWDTNRFPAVSEAHLGRSQETQKEITEGTPLDPNTASLEELQLLKGIGPVLAERIIAHRPYKSIEGLERVPGIGPKKLDQIRPFLVIEPSTP